MSSIVSRLCNLFWPSKKQNAGLPESTGDKDEVGDPKLKIFDEGWGHSKSRESRVPLDANGESLPWFTYPAIEYLRQLDLTNARVLEWGAGGSTLFWGKHCRQVVTVERTKTWFDEISPRVAGNTQLILAPDKADYVRAGHEENFDIIVIDGEHRRDCVETAISRLSPGGIIILDNSDWYTKAAEKLRKLGFAQFDFSGFGPVNDYTWSTSIYIRGEFMFEPRFERLPMHGVGALDVFAPEEADPSEEGNEAAGGS